MKNEIVASQAIVIVMLVGLVVWQRYKREIKKWWKAQHKKPRRKWQLRPRSPLDCSDCCTEAQWSVKEHKRSPRPWRDVKSQRGRPKTVDSDGYACMNLPCEYYGETDARIHALRSNGKRGACEDIQQWECGACGSTHTARLGTPMYQLKTSSEAVALALHLIAKGVSVADVSEVLGYRESTLRGWVERAGKHSERLHRHAFKPMIVRHLQLDELVGKVRRMMKRVWIWAGIDTETKVIVGVHVGGRKQQDAHQLIHKIMKCLAPGCIPVCSSDGLRQYFYALTAHFGQWEAVEGKRKPVWIVAPELLYGQLRKRRAGYRLKQAYTKVLCGTREAYQSTLTAIGLSGQVQTAYVERLNLTLRHIVGPLRRRTWAITQTVMQLRWHVEWGRADYHFCRTHESLRVDMGDGHYRGRTPAMAAGVTHRKWQVRDILLLPLYAA
jgi:IS1 family transposase/transposase-like protein